MVKKAIASSPRPKAPFKPGKIVSRVTIPSRGRYPWLAAAFNLCRWQDDDQDWGLDTIRFESKPSNRHKEDAILTLHRDHGAV